VPLQAYRRYMSLMDKLRYKNLELISLKKLAVPRLRNLGLRARRLGCGGTGIVVVLVRHSHKYSV
jgi:hypothetical protein